MKVTEQEWDAMVAQLLDILLAEPDLRELKVNHELQGDFWSRQSVSQIVTDLSVAFRLAVQIELALITDEAQLMRVEAEAIRTQSNDCWSALIESGYQPAEGQLLANAIKAALSAR